MKPRSERSLKLYDILLERGYPKGFCYEVTANLNTDWTADRMIGYLDIPMRRSRLSGVA